MTGEVMSNIHDLPEVGVLHLFVLHTSCGVSLGENFDPDVRVDMRTALDRIVPEDESLYRHTDEGPDDMPSHVKSALIGTSLTIPIADHKLCLGTWQGIYLHEFRNHGGRRRFVATIIS